MRKLMRLSMAYLGQLDAGKRRGRRGRFLEIFMVYCMHLKQKLCHQPKVDPVIWCDVLALEEQLGSRLWPLPEPVGCEQSHSYRVLIFESPI